MLNHYLVIDTATDHLYVSLVKEGRVVYEYIEKGNKDHAIKLMPTIQEAMESSSLKSLEGIVVGIGPGSYTGVRMGVVVAKMLAVENGLKLYTLSSLCLKASYANGKVASIIDARRHHVFAGIYDYSQENVVIKDDAYILLDELKKEIDSNAIVSSFKPDILKLNQKNLFKKVEDIHRLTPNYLRKTQAENEHQNS